MLRFQFFLCCEDGLEVLLDTLQFCDNVVKKRETIFFRIFQHEKRFGPTYYHVFLAAAFSA